MEGRFAGFDRVDMVVDVRPSSGLSQFRAWQELFFYLDEDAAWVALRTEAQHVEPLLSRLDRIRGGGTALAHAIKSIGVTDRFVTIEKQQRHLLKIRDGETRSLLATREPQLKIGLVGTRPAGEFTPTAEATSYSGVEPGYDKSFSFPQLEIRRYEGELVLPRTTMVYHNRSVLPDSFRWHLAQNPKTSGLVNVRDKFGLLEESQEPLPLPGSYYHFGYNNPGHFGHLMTEALARLWGWAEAKEADASLKLLCRLHPNPERFRPAERRLESVLLPAFGVDAADIVWVDRPVRVESLVGVTPMWHNTEPYYVHPEIRGVWERLRKGLTAGPPTPASDKLFVTRPPSANRTCHNSREVEDLFSSRGFSVVEPGQLTVQEQASMFANARVVAGFGGSGMFNLVYADGVDSVIVLNHTSYIARNEYMFASVLGAESHFFWSEPDDPHPAGEFSQRSFQSSWTFDLERNASALTRVLERVG